MSKSLSVLSLILVIIVSIGCQGNNAVRTISTGSHVPFSDEKWEKIQNKKDDKLRFVVWGNHAGATQAAVELLQQSGQTVVERARLQELFDEQQIRLTHTSDDDSRVLKVGRLVGADRVVFVEASDRSEVVSGAYVGPYGGASRSNTVHQVSVAVRAVDIANGEVRWSGHSTMTQAITDPEVALPMLTKAAMSRATCALERGNEWIELGSNYSGQWGCRKKESNPEN
jgi:hypothetical protein